jgi:hypothetical protein
MPPVLCTTSAATGAPGVTVMVPPATTVDAGTSTAAGLELVECTTAPWVRLAKRTLPVEGHRPSRGLWLAWWID